MKKQTNLVPKRRFKEFQNTNTWEQRKLSDGTLKIGDGLHGTPNYTDDGDVYFVNGNNLVNGEIIITEETKRVTTDEQSKDDKALDENTLLMSINGTIGNLAWYKGEKLMLGKSAAFITVSDFDKKFIYAYLQTDGVHNYFLNNLTGTTIKNLGLKAIRETKLFVPVIEEQSKIGSFFAKLDNLITLHQRKLEKTKALKSAYLSEMFPAEGERVPKRRFAGFTQPWEQRKVGEIFKVTRGQVLAATETSENKTDETPYPVYSSQTKNDGLMGYYKDYLFDTAITWTTDGANAGTVNYRNGKFYSTNVNGVLLSDEGYANKAVAEALNLVAWKYVSRVGNPKLMNNTMSDIIISLPLDIKEQDKISEFLESIDHLITLHQRKLEKLQNLKKAYLNEMFV
ncbi:restriction endonuclease subunit S [Weizmannia sp. CD-2023]|uniref:restriction endonuclease subunit S n=1 Tax=Weizmannia sp. CD-2023 TaxID=3037263 RepID=UPI002E1D7111|nr:restriction endonuclease subunit S [Weizmannia sp. CD-2023]MED4920010.1 restriction endonuclease subunit S [Weizmannia sp. CD-2023]